jgi:hypothetical protein
MSSRDHLKTVFLVLSAFATGAGCSTSTPIGVVDINAGGTSGTAVMGAAGAGGAPAQQGPYVPDGAQVFSDKPFTSPPGVPVDWVGYLEAYTTTNGLDVVKLHFGTDASGNETLIVTRGTGTVPPPPTDAYQPWPAPLVNADGTPTGVDPFPDPMSGFGFTARNVTWQGQRLTFVIAAAEPWAPWCALQRSYPLDPHGNPSSGFGCDRPAGSFEKGTCTFLVAPKGGCDVNHQEMCEISKICACNATGCGAEGNLRMAYDITFFGDHATGTGEEHSLLLMPAAPSP